MRRAARAISARAIIEGDDQHELVVVPGQVFGFIEQPADLGIETFALADDTHAHAFAVKVGEIVANKAAQQRHQLADFGCRTRPVLGAERENREKADTEIAGGAYRATERLDAAAVAFPTRQPARRRPAPVAVHDDGNVPRYGEMADPGGAQRLALRHPRDLTP
jgi:hypothetical protein